MRIIICACAGLLCVTLASAQDYEIVDRAGRVTATATIQRGQLIVVESTGERIVFKREPRYDSADQRFRAFLNLNLQRVLRLPSAGHGVMQIAELDDPQPQFRNTLRSVRVSEVDTRFGYVPGQGYPYGWNTNSQQGSYPYISGYRPARPRSVLIDTKTTANPPLPVAKLTLVNSGPEELLVTVVDLKLDQPKELRIRPSQRIDLELQRDAGAKRVQRYQTINIYGDPVIKQVVTDIPPAVRHEIIVHQWVLQSIAIDRTGKSPSPIEDMNFQGKGLGRFTLPPGDQLQTGTLDVYRAALSARNQGSVTPITAQEKQIGDALPPLQRAIQDLQQRDRGRR